MEQPLASTPADDSCPVWLDLLAKFGTMALNDALSWPLLFHWAVVVMFVWWGAYFGLSFIAVLVVSVFYLSQVSKRQLSKLERVIKQNERKEAELKHPLTDSESARWLNSLQSKVWPAFLERLMSTKIVPAILPWFLKKYKPWHIRKAKLEQLFLGSASPRIESLRFIPSENLEDDVILECTMEFVASEDMQAIISAQTAKKLTLGVWTKCHVSKLVLESKVKIGLKFDSDFPFVSRARLCFTESPYVSLCVKPIGTFGLDMTEVPGVAGWIDKILSGALEDSMVEPKMLVIDVQKLMAQESAPATTAPQKQPSPVSGDFFHFEETPPKATALVEILEATNLRPPDSNGQPDCLVKGAIGANRFRTRLAGRSVSPVWGESFRVPVVSWNRPNLLVLRVLSKDLIGWESMGYCVVDLNGFQDKQGVRRVFWENLRGVKVGRLRVAVTLQGGKEKETVKEAMEPLPSIVRDGSFAFQIPKAEAAQFVASLAPANEEEPGVTLARPEALENAQVSRSCPASPDLSLSFERTPFDLGMEFAGAVGPLATPPRSPLHRLFARKNNAKAAKSEPNFDKAKTAFAVNGRQRPVVKRSGSDPAIGQTAALRGESEGENLGAEVPQGAVWPVSDTEAEEAVDVGVGLLGCVAVVRPRRHTESPSWRPRQGGRWKEAAAVTGYLDGDCSKSKLEKAIDSMSVQGAAYSPSEFSSEEELCQKQLCAAMVQHEMEGRERAVKVKQERWWKQIIKGEKKFKG